MVIRLTPNVERPRTARCPLVGITVAVRGGIWLRGYKRHAPAARGYRSSAVCLASALYPATEPKQLGTTQERWRVECRLRSLYPSQEPSEHDRQVGLQLSPTRSRPRCPTESSKPQSSCHGDTTTTFFKCDDSIAVSWVNVCLRVWVTFARIRRHVVFNTGHLG
jgi:hypothetical protein